MFINEPKKDMYDGWEITISEGSEKSATFMNCKTHEEAIQKANDYVEGLKNVVS